MTRRPTIASSGTYLTRPLTMVRASPSPTSIFSTYRLRGLQGSGWGIERASG